MYREADAPEKALEVDLPGHYRACSPLDVFGRQESSPRCSTTRLWVSELIEDLGRHHRRLFEALFSGRLRDFKPFNVFWRVNTTNRQNHGYETKSENNQEGNVPIVREHCGILKIADGLHRMNTFPTQ